MKFSRISLLCLLLGLIASPTFAQKGLKFGGFFLPQASVLYNADDFDSQKAYQRLEKWTFVRQTSSIGQFSLYRQAYYLGKAYAKQYIAVKFLSKTVEWQIFDAQGLLINSYYG